MEAIWTRIFFIFATFDDFLKLESTKNIAKLWKFVKYEIFFKENLCSIYVQSISWTWKAGFCWLPKTSLTCDPKSSNTFSIAANMQIIPFGSFHLLDFQKNVEKFLMCLSIVFWKNLRKYRIFKLLYTYFTTYLLFNGRTDKWNIFKFEEISSIYTSWPASRSGQVNSNFQHFWTKIDMTNRIKLGLELVVVAPSCFFYKTNI